jgi:hypothetical protein
LVPETDAPTFCSVVALFYQPLKIAFGKE